MLIFFLIFSFLLGNQDSTVIRKYGVFDHATIQRIEMSVREGEMSREEANSRYLYYLQNNLNRLKKKESVIKSKFREVGVYDVKVRVHPEYTAVISLCIGQSDAAIKKMIAEANNRKVFFRV